MNEKPTIQYVHCRPLLFFFFLFSFFDMSVQWEGKGGVRFNSVTSASWGVVSSRTSYLIGTIAGHFYYLFHWNTSQIIKYRKERQIITFVTNKLDMSLCRQLNATNSSPYPFWLIDINKNEFNWKGFLNILLARNIKET
jgi:hypothetical protein